MSETLTAVQFLELVRELRQLGATSVEYGGHKVSFAVGTVLSPMPKNTEKVDPRKLSTEELKEIVRRKELGR